MRRPPVSIVILAWNAWSETRACLESLRPTLGVRDQVIVVDNGSTDETPGQLPRYPWAQVVTNEQNRGFAGGCNDGAAISRNEIIVFLNNDTILAGHWIDALVNPFTDDQVGATGPRSNFVSGPQIADGASYIDGTGLRQFARQWAFEHRGLATETPRLVGFCLAVRRDVFEAVGGFDEGYGIGGYEDDDLCRRIVDSGRTLMIAHESFVHHAGHKTFDANGLDWFDEQQRNRERFVAAHGGEAPQHPLVSACLITKDEEENIELCIASLAGFADEIVIYDTGSSDRTIELAESLGAKVFPGFWDDDFGRARNASLEHCVGDWIAWLDADETLVCNDIPGLKSLLRSAKPEIDGWSVAINNKTGVGIGAGFVHHATRLFRRSSCEWTGRLHEQVAGRGDHRGIRQEHLELAYIHHTGYLEEAMRSRNKTERNLRVAEAEVAAANNWDQGFALTSLGRAYLTGGQFEPALERCREAVQSTTNLITLRLAHKTCAEALMGLARFEEALSWVTKFRKLCTDPSQANACEAKIRLALGDPAKALELLDSLSGSGTDEDGFECSAVALSPVKAQALATLGRPGEAADVLINALEEQGILDTHLGTIIELLREADRPLTDLAAAIPPERSSLFLAQIVQLSPEIADQMLEVCWEVSEHKNPVLAAAASVGRRLVLDRSLVWSSRLRSGGFAEACPLMAIATGGAPAILRARAAATVLKVFGDPSAQEAFTAAFKSATDTERSTIETEAGLLCPEALDVARRQTEDEQALRPGPESASPQPVPSDQLSRGLTVSIVIPCFDKAELTLACLQSLQQHTDTSLYETIIVDNGSTDATRQLATLSGDRFRVLRNEENTGFGPACNQGAAVAQGEYILFLNNDTLLTKGWLEPLIEALDEDTRIGAVQPKLIYPDGRLNDAGGLVFHGGKPWIYGKGHPDPDAPQFSSRRAPCYASGACLVVRRTAFEQIGGFDDRYAPAYYEDTDLSFAMRDAGWKVLYEPASTVVHVEGGTAGTDETVGLKVYQVRNADRFIEKWNAELDRREPLDPAIVDAWAHRPQGGWGPGEDRQSEPAKDPAMNQGLRILVVDPSMPTFDKASGSLRMFNLLRSLRRAGHAVTFYGIGGGERRYADAVGKFGVVCYGGEQPRFTEPEYRATYFPPLERLLLDRPYDVVILSPWTSGEMLHDIVRRTAHDALLILDTNDVHFVRLQRAAELSGDKQDEIEALETRHRELAVYRRADRLICVTEDDAKVIRTEIPTADVVVVPNAHDTVDPGPGFDQRSGLCFIGNFLHRPNGDAVRWWKSEIKAIVDERSPGLTLTVAGNDPGGEAAALSGDGITVHGYVPSTLPVLHLALISVAPLRYGAGMKGKVGEALAAGTPVIATSVAAEGMCMEAGRHYLRADTPAEFADAIALLRTDRALWEELRENGRRLVQERFGLDTMLSRIPDLVNRQAGTRANTRSGALSGR